MNFNRDHSIASGLNYVATWNSAMLLFGGSPGSGGGDYAKTQVWV